MEKSGNSSVSDVEFNHGVASGDPLPDRVIIWTRLTTDDTIDVVVHWEVSEDNLFSTIYKRGVYTTNQSSDHTVKVDVTNLEAGKRYYYRFKSNGVTSVTGETQTIETSELDVLSLGIVSCSNYQFGYFSAYRHLANKNIDAVLHLGDYFYEHGPDGYGDKNFERKHNPPKEILTLTDYRTRYAQYRSDEDLQYIHQKHPFIAIWGRSRNH